MKDEHFEERKESNLEEINLDDDYLEYDAYSVEDAPDVESLDDLLDDFDTEEEKIPEDIEPVEYPHIRVSTKRFSDVLKLSANVSQGAGRDKVSRSVGLEASEGFLNIYMTDSDIYAEKVISLMNNENVLQGYFAVNHSMISKAVKACPASTVIYRKDGKYFMKLEGGDLEIGTEDINKDDMILPEKENFEKIGTLDTAEFYRIIKDLFPLVSRSASSSQRRIFMGGKIVYAIYLYSITTYESERDFPEMDINVKNLKSLYPLALSCEIGELEVFRRKGKMSRVLIVGDNFSYSFLLSKFKPSQHMMDNMDKILDNKFVYVDYGHLVKISDLSEGLNYSIYRLDFNYDGGRVRCLLKTKKSDVDFLLRGKEEEEVKPLDKHVSVQTTLVSTVIKAFSQETLVGICLDVDGIGIISDKYKSVVYREGQ